MRQIKLLVVLLSLVLFANESFAYNWLVMIYNDHANDLNRIDDQL